MIRNRTRDLGAAAIAAALVVCAACRTAREPRSGGDAPARADLASATCLGPADATRFAVYLHGIDSRSPSEQELGNRAVLAHVAEALGMRIALPRGEQACGTSGAICWQSTYTDAEFDAAAKAVDAAARSCFGARPFGLIGFSSGGYLATAMLRKGALEGRLPAARWMVSVAAGMMRGPIEPVPASLAGSVPLVILVGTADPTNDPDDNYEKRLRAKGADVRTVRFDGGHELRREPLERILRELRP